MRGSVNDLQLLLSYGAIQALLEGASLSFRLDGAEVTVALSEEGLREMQDRYRTHLLAKVDPVGPMQ